MNFGCWNKRRPQENHLNGWILEQHCKSVMICISHTCSAMINLYEIFANDYLTVIRKKEESEMTLRKENQYDRIDFSVLQDFMQKQEKDESRQRLSDR